MAKNFIEYYQVAINDECCAVKNDVGRVSARVPQSVFSALMNAHIDCELDGKCLRRQSGPAWDTKSYNGELQIPVRIIVSTMKYRITPTPNCCQSDVRIKDRKSCAEMLARGECTDARMRATVGRVLYPHLYAQKVK